MPVSNYTALIHSQLGTIPNHMVIACSGGPDSIFLASIMATAFPNHPFPILYCDHGLRPHEVRREIDLVRSFGRARSMPVHVLTLTIQEKNQQAYRRERVRCMARACHQMGCHTVVLGHHLDDDIETFIMQWLRGATTRLRGIPDQSEFYGIRFVHPLLGVPKQHILDYLTQHRIDYCTDSSNDQPIYARNRIRHAVTSLPIHPDSTRSVRQTLVFLKQQTQRWVAEARALYQTGYRLLDSSNHGGPLLTPLRGQSGGPTPSLWDSTTVTRTPGVHLFPRDRFLAVVNPELQLKTMLEIGLNVSVNANDVTKIKRGLTTSSLTTIPLSNMTVLMDYKWIMIYSHPMPDRLSQPIQLGRMPYYLGHIVVTKSSTTQSSTRHRLAVPTPPNFSVSPLRDTATRFHSIKKRCQSARLSPIDQYFYPSIYASPTLYWIPGICHAESSGPYVIRFFRSVPLSGRGVS